MKSGLSHFIHFQLNATNRHNSLHSKSIETSQLCLFSNGCHPYSIFNELLNDVKKKLKKDIENCVESVDRKSELQHNETINISIGSYSYRCENVI